MHVLEGTFSSDVDIEVRATAKKVLGGAMSSLLSMTE